MLSDACIDGKTGATRHCGRIHGHYCAVMDGDIVAVNGEQNRR